MAGIAAQEMGLDVETDMDYDDLNDTAVNKGLVTDENTVPLSSTAEPQVAQANEIQQDTDAETLISINNLYRSLNIAPENAEDDGWRLDALHIFGTHELSTDELLEFFAAYSPSSVEWIDDASCNVVWADKVGPARALLGLTAEIGPDGAAVKQETSGSGASAQVADSAMPGSLPVNEQGIAHNTADSSGVESGVASSVGVESVSAADRLETGELSISEPIGSSATAMADVEAGKVEKPADEADEENYIVVEEPPLDYIWRRTRGGVPNRHGDRFLLFVRIARDDDKKRRGAHLRSRFYLKYGNPHFDGIRSLVSRSLRQKLTAKQIRRLELDGKLERMRADLRTRRSNSYPEDADADTYDYEPAVRRPPNHDGALIDPSMATEGAELGDQPHVWATVAERLGENDAGQSRPRDFNAQSRPAQGTGQWRQPYAQRQNSANSADFDSLLNTFRANQVVRKARERQRVGVDIPYESSRHVDTDEIEDGEVLDVDEEGEVEEQAASSARNIRGRGEKRMRMQADAEDAKVREADRRRSSRRSTDFDPEEGRLSVSVLVSDRHRDRLRSVDYEKPRRRSGADDYNDTDSRPRVRVDVTRDARDRLGKRKVSLDDESDHESRDFDDAPRKQKDLRDVLRSRRVATATHRHGGLKVVFDK